MSDIHLISAIMFASIMIFFIYSLPLKYGMPFQSLDTINTRKIYLGERGK